MQDFCRKILLQCESIYKYNKSTYLGKKGCAFVFQIRKGYDSESKTFRLPIELIGKLEELAAQNKLSLNQLVIQCLTYAVDNLEVQGNGGN